MSEKKKVLAGLCCCTEAGCWAFQDRRFIVPNTTYFSCVKCHTYWDKEKYPDGLPITAEQGGSVVLTHMAPVETRSDARNYKIPTKCLLGKHKFELIWKENWLHDGLYILKDRDHLTIYSLENPEEVVWSGTIALHQSIYANQKGIDWETWATWFSNEHPAKLIPASQK